MDQDKLVATRRSLHGVAELLMDGPQYRAEGTIRLRVTPGGFATVATGVAVDGAELVWPTGRAALVGTYRDLATAAGIDIGPPVGIYDDGPGIGPEEALAVDPDAAAVLAGWWAAGEAALRTVAGGVEPVLWPEHFDLAATSEGLTYGVSPGDGGIAEPYAYVLPPEPRTGPFWNAPFGAARTASELTGPDAVAAFFAEGRHLAG
jgi:hypothetical protein